MKTKLPRILLICNGEPPSRVLAHALAERSDFIVAADGGANIARAVGLLPDFVVGDLDSITQETRRHFAGVQVLHVTRQDNTDLEKALDVIADEGECEVTILGATGNRLDFTLANLSVLWNYTRRVHWNVRGDGWRAFPVVGRTVIDAPRGATVSLVPFGPCSGITLRGMRYPLRNAAMKIGKVGVSNVVASKPCTVEVKKGKMLVILFEAKT
jgi:thiamine pyrophosphokinase